VWQNSRLAILWDLSYILENSYRISLGDFPYRDFPFPYAPGSFLVQSLLIRLTGRVFFHHVLYCAIVGGLGTILTWRILIHVLRDALVSFRLVAFLLAAPLTVLGIYCVFPHPFYDPDCTFVILCGVLLLLQLERKGYPPLRAFLAGIVLVVPLLVKQNTGLAFFATAALAFLGMIARHAWHRQSVSGFAWLLAGMTSGLLGAILLLHFTVGMRNYWHWTMQFAASRRLPGISEMFAPYQNPLLLLWFAAFAVGALIMRRNQCGSRMFSVLSVALIAAPFVWTVLYLFVEEDPAERAERLLALWPFVLIVSLFFALWDVRKGLTVTRLLPFILVGTVQGAFLSQQLWGSTYALWPLLTILLAANLAELFRMRGERSSRWIESLAGVTALSMLISGGFYTASHERLNYADVSTGEVNRSTLPVLAGLAMRGPWIPQFEELVRYTDREIPKDQGLLMIPGEDLFYYTTGRRPRFPVLMFDHTVNPYTPEEIVEISRQRNICWIILKKNLQRKDDPVEDRIRLLDLLRSDFAPVQSLTDYEIFQRNGGSACPENVHSPPNGN
jgi:4-amino-4-deoxy-L-arabinose transferase-like glycosyltransferase